MFIPNEDSYVVLTMRYGQMASLRIKEFIDLRGPSCNTDTRSCLGRTQRIENLKSKYVYINQNRNLIMEAGGSAVIYMGFPCEPLTRHLSGMKENFEQISAHYGCYLIQNNLAIQCSSINPTQIKLMTKSL